jgi:RNA polymerase sigma factor for flagellar operon FliA
MTQKAGYVATDHTFDEFFQAGMIGLWQATERYDPAGGAAFYTYAAVRVQGAMIDLLRDEHDYASRRTRREMSEIEGARRRLSHELGREPRARELADVLNIALEEYHAMCTDDDAQKVMELDAIGHADDADSNEDHGAVFNQDRVTPLDELLASELSTTIEEIVNSDALLPSERNVLLLKVNDGMNLQAIGDLFGFTESRASQLYTKAVTKLRRNLTKRGLA